MDHITITNDSLWIGALALIFIASYLGHIAVQVRRIANALEKKNK
jgi:hypothetical protein